MRLTPSLTQFRFIDIVRSMTTTRDVSRQSGISKTKVEGDGSFKRAPSSFRNWIKKGSQFEPEPGLFNLLMGIFCALPLNQMSTLQIATIFMSRTRVVSVMKRWVLGSQLITVLPLSPAWATRTLIVRKLKGLEDIIRKPSWHDFPFLMCDARELQLLPS
jgi:glutathionyl-hydroquinone reductase